MEMRSAVPARRGCRAEEALRVGSGGDVDVAALAIGEHEQAGGAGVRNGRGQRVPAGCTEALEAGDLRLDGDDGIADRVDDRAAMGEDGSRGAGRGAGAERTRRGVFGLGPERERIGIEAEHDLRLALGDRGGQAIGKTLAQGGGMRSSEPPTAHHPVARQQRSPSWPSRGRTRP